MTALLFGFEGRIGRGPFWTGQAVVLALVLVGLIVFYLRAASRVEKAARR